MPYPTRRDDRPLLTQLLWGALGGALFVLVFALAASAATRDEFAPLAPPADGPYTSGRILSKLERSHFREQSLDDALSDRLYERYLDALDPGRMFFVAADLAAFERYRYELDDALQDGDTEAAFAIFNLGTERRMQRLDAMLGWIADIPELSFDGDEQLDLDRSESPWPADLDEARSLWRLMFRNDVLNLRLADRDAEQIAETLTRRYENQRLRLTQLESGDVFRIWMNVVTHSFDPHTEYFPPRDAENFDIQMSLSLEGIGALLGSNGEYCTVERIIPGGPAEKDGRLQPADRIVAVGQDTEGELIDVVGWRNDEIVEHIRGPKDTVVRLQVLPAAQGEAAMPTLITIVRDEVKLEEQSARSQVIELADDEGPWRVGVITLPAFYIDFEAARTGDPEYKSATRDVARLIEELSEDGIDGIVMDLRGNGGGSLTEAQQLTSLFLGGGPVVQIQAADGRSEVAGVPSTPPLWSGPLTVLVDRLSASASEIFSAAVQDTGRGVVVGSRTFGKGTVQSLTPLGQGQLKITQAMFFRLSGGSTQNEGVQPDVLLPPMYDEDVIGESALEDALPWRRIDAVKVKRSNAVANLRDELQSRHDARMTSDPELAAVAAQLAYRDELRERTTVSLNEQQRVAERDQVDARLLEIENARREALGQEPLASLADQDAERDPDEADPYAREAARVLVDFIEARDALRSSRQVQVR